MDPNTSNIDEIVDTSSPERANELRRGGWVVLAIGKGQDANGEACLRYTLGWKGPGSPAPSASASNDALVQAAIAATRMKSSS